MSTAAIGAGGSTIGYPARLSSINLRPVVQEPTSNGESDSNASGQGSTSTATPEREPGSRRDATDSDQSSGSNSFSPSTFNPSSRFTLIGGEGAAPPAEESGSGNGDASEAGSVPSESPTPNESANPLELSPAERRKVQELKRIDAKVRSHEQAHLAAAGQYAQGGISFETVTGPDGKEYAVAGEVSLDTSEADTPKKTIEKMRQVKSAALAPASPSPQDRQIATQAARKLTEARREQSQQEQDGESGVSTNSAGGSTDTAEPEQPGSSTGFEGPEDFGASGPGESRGDQPSSPEAPSTRNRSGDSTSPVDQFITEGTGNDPSARTGRKLNLLA